MAETREMHLFEIQNEEDEKRYLDALSHCQGECSVIATLIQTINGADGVVNVPLKDCAIRDAKVLIDVSAGNVNFQIWAFTDETNQIMKMYKECESNDNYSIQIITMELNEVTGDCYYLGMVNPEFCIYEDNHLILSKDFLHIFFNHTTEDLLGLYAEVDNELEARFEAEMKDLENGN